jgi:Flp pilus assembly protein TadG
MMISSCKIVSLLSRSCDLILENRGAAAVEFAIVLPFMLLLYVGGIELGDGMAIQVKVTDTAHIVADLTTQNANISNATMKAILGASSATIAPYAASNVTVTVSEISTDASGNATVTWSDSLNGTARNAGDPFKLLPPSLAGQPNISLIYGEVSYKYTPNLGYTITGTVTISDSYFLFPRNSNSIVRVTT